MNNQITFANIFDQRQNSQNIYSQRTFINYFDKQQNYEYIYPQKH